MYISHPRPAPKAFTLIELLVVIAIIAILAAILFPVFSQTREKARQTVCLSNEKQIGTAFLMYSQDYDEFLPIGNGSKNNGWRTCGWAGELVSYLKNRNVFFCPDDDPASNISYAFNQSLDFGANGYGNDPLIAKMAAPGSTVLLLEITSITGYHGEATYGVKAFDPTNPAETLSPSADGGCSSANFTSAAGQSGGQYATGAFHALSDYTCYYHGGGMTGRHNGGSNFLACDGHAKWLVGKAVSPGVAAPTSLAAESSATGLYNAAGTGNLPSGVVMTFSAK